MSWTKRNLAPIGLLFASMAIAAGEQTDKKTLVKKELKKLAGTWEVLSVESDGRKGAGDDIKGLAYVFEANGKWKLQKDGDTQAEGTFTIDPTKETPTIDYKIVESTSEQSKGKSSLGIYNLDADGLKVCRTWPDNDQRPTAFEAGAGSKCILTEFKRKAKEQTTAKKELTKPDKNALDAMAISADGTLAVTGGTEGVVSVWDLRRKHRSQVIRVGHPVLALALAQHGKLLAIGCDSKDGVRLWARDADEFSFRQSLPEKWRVEAVALSPNGKTLACGAFGHGTIHVHDLAAGRRIGTLFEPSNFTSALAFSPDGKRLASAGNDIICWDLSPESLRKTRPEREGRTLEELEADAAQALLWRAKHTDEYSADVAFSADGKLLAGVTGVGRLDTGGHVLRVWDAASGKLLQTIAWEKMNCVTFLPGGKEVVTGHDDGQMTVWNVAREQCVRRWQGHKKAVRAVMVVPGSSDLASIGADGAFRIWDPTVGPLQVWDAGPGPLKYRFQPSPGQGQRWLKSSRTKNMS